MESFKQVMYGIRWIGNFRRLDWKFSMFFLSYPFQGSVSFSSFALLCPSCEGDTCYPDVAVSSVGEATLQV